VAILTRVFGDIDTAEDAVQDAFAEAARRWPEAGLPPSPAGLLHAPAGGNAGVVPPGQHREPDQEEGPVRDDRLRLMFTCCHPALGTGAQVAR
jgi:RNA polymerase sigma-70 factor, ECF subfamily